MARRTNNTANPVTQPKEETPNLYVWKRLQGKHHLRTPKGIVTVSPGETLVATKEAYAHDEYWELVGPVEGAEEEKEVPASALIKVPAMVEGAFDVLRDGEPVNDAPLTEEEADELVDASLERS